MCWLSFCLVSSQIPWKLLMANTAMKWDTVVECLKILKLQNNTDLHFSNSLSKDKTNWETLFCILLCISLLWSQNMKSIFSYSLIKALLKIEQKVCCNCPVWRKNTSDVYCQRKLGCQATLKHSCKACNAPPVQAFLGNLWVCKNEKKVFM